MQWTLDRFFSSIKRFFARSAPHHRGYARGRDFCWHGAFKALLAWYYTYHHLQQSSTPMLHSPSSVLPEIVTKLLVSFLCLLISAKSYPLISYSCDLPACQLIYVLGSPAHPSTLVRSSELAMLLLCITHTSPPSLRDCCSLRDCWWFWGQTKIKFLKICLSLPQSLVYHRGSLSLPWRNGCVVELFLVRIFNVLLCSIHPLPAIVRYLVPL